MFKRKKVRRKSKTDMDGASEAKLSTIIELIKDLERTDYNRLRAGMDLIYNGYQKIRTSKTMDEKELADIDESEKFLEVEASK